VAPANPGHISLQERSALGSSAFLQLPFVLVKAFSRNRQFGLFLGLCSVFKYAITPVSVRIGQKSNNKRNKAASH